jgi:prepilin-type N-terminal cleavage/methylation domain-containing protein
MTTTIVRSRQTGTAKGFTLVEVMVVMTLSVTLMAGVLSMFLFTARSSLRLGFYSEMAREARVGVELFSREARMAKDIVAFSSGGVRLLIPDKGGDYEVEFTYDPQRRVLTRQVGGTERILIRNIETLTFTRFNLQRDPATNHLETKQLQMRLRASQRRASTAEASNTVLTARIIMRNKRVARRPHSRR